MPSTARWDHRRPLPAAAFATMVTVLAAGAASASPGARTAAVDGGGVSAPVVRAGVAASTPGSGRLRLSTHGAPTAPRSPLARSLPRLAPSVPSVAQLPQTCTKVAGVNDMCPTWTATYDNANPGTHTRQDQDVTTAIAVSSTLDRTVVTGASYDATTGLDYATVAYDSAGTQVWAKRYDDGNAQDDEALALALSPDGSVAVVTGVGSDSFVDSTKRCTTIAYDVRMGQTLWTAIYPSASLCHAAVFGADGRLVYVAGSSWDASAQANFLTAAYDARTGRPAWTAVRHTGSTSAFSAATGLAVTPDGFTVVVTGASSAGADFSTVAYDARSGAQLWTAAYGSSGSYYEDVVIALSHDGSRTFVAGTETQGTASATGGPPSTYDTIAYDTRTGVQLWQASYASATNASAVARAIAVSPDSAQVYVTGSAAQTVQGQPAPDTFSTVGTVAYAAASGSQEWHAEYAVPGYAASTGTDIAVSPDGSRIYVAGCAKNGGPALSGTGGLPPVVPTVSEEVDATVGDLVTVAYDRTGSLQSTARYDNAVVDGISSAEAGTVLPEAHLALDGASLLVAGSQLDRDDVHANSPAATAAPSQYLLLSYAR